MLFKKFLKEEETILTPSVKKRFMEMGKKVNYENRYQSIFKGQDRIYIPYKGKSINVGVDNSLLSYLHNLSVKMSSKTGWKNIKLDLEKDIFEYEENGQKKEIKINKAIDDFSGDSIRVNQKFKGMIKGTATKNTKKFDKLKIVISRNPCDIAAMSTNRGWKSCMNLHSGEQKRYVQRDVELGTLVAYLIDETDEDIDKPLGRVLIKPYYSDNKEHVYLRVSNRTYGVFPEEVRKVVDNFFKDNQKDVEKSLKELKIFRLDPNLYTDREPTALELGPKNKKDDKEKQRFKKGDKVICISPPDGRRELVGATGTVIETDYDEDEDGLQVMVRFNVQKMPWWCEHNSLKRVE